MEQSSPSETTSRIEIKKDSLCVKWVHEINVKGQHAPYTSGLSNASWLLKKILAQRSLFPTRIEWLQFVHKGKVGILRVYNELMGPCQKKS